MLPAAMLFRASLAAAVWGPFVSAAERSGQATVEWISASPTYEAGKPVRTAFRMKLDDGWHTYWTNPGEGGMKLSVKWDLPEGWSAADEVEHPVPMRFFTGGLAGFGYEGTVVFPVELTPSPGADGQVKVGAKISWLTCNDSSCVPGSADLEIDLRPGPMVASKDAAAIEAASRLVPRPVGKTAALEVRERAEGVELRLTGGFPADPADARVFPETPQALDAAAPIEFVKTGGAWTATVPKNEYAKGPLKTLTLVFSAEGASAPFSVTWSGK